jgi:hypothetical protein
MSKDDGKVDYGAGYIDTQWRLVWVLMSKAEDNVIVVSATNKSLERKVPQVPRPAALGMTSILLPLDTLNDTVITRVNGCA